MRMAMGMAIRGKRFSKYVSDYVVFDLETTGVSTQMDQVIEISAVIAGNSRHAHTPRCQQGEPHYG